MFNSDRIVSIALAVMICILLANVSRALSEISAPRSSIRYTQADVVDVSRESTPKKAEPTKETEIQITPVPGMDILKMSAMPREFSIDWDKVKTVQDVITILRELDIVVTEGTLEYERMKPYLTIETESGK